MKAKQWRTRKDQRAGNSDDILLKNSDFFIKQMMFIYVFSYIVILRYLLDI